MMKERSFTTRAVKLNYLDYGSPSAQPLVLLHGGAWCWQEYLSLIPILARGWHVCAVDLRGNGRSGWTPGEYRLQDFTQDVVEFVEHLHAPAVLAGHSIGGVVALMAAARCPQRVKAVIIEDSPLDLENYQRVVDSSRDMFSIWLELKKSALSERHLCLSLADAFQAYPTITSQWITFFAGCLWQLDPTFFDVLLHDFSGFTTGYDYKDIFAKIDCPILCMRGEPRLGAVMTDREVDWLKENVSTLSYVPIEGVGHLLHMEEHGQAPVQAEMKAFLDRIQ